jgi:hypothetical protein
MRAIDQLLVPELLLYFTKGRADGFHSHCPKVEVHDNVKTPPQNVPG